MKQFIAILLLFAASISMASCVELKAGNAFFDLGDGYKASFVLPDIGTSYVLDYAYADRVAVIDVLKSKAYGFTVSSSGINLASVTMDVYSSPQFEFVPKAHTEDSAAPDTVGPRVITPKTINGAPGYVGYDLQVGTTGTDTSNAMTGYFKYFPGAWKESNDLKSIFEVYGETSGLPASAQSLQVLNSLVDSIKISGPGI